MESQPLVTGAKEPKGDLLENDPTFRGFKSTSERSCRDIIFAVLFLMVFGGMVVVSCIAFERGRPELLIPSYVADHVQEKTVSGLQDSVAQIKSEQGVLIGAAALAVGLGFIWIQLLKMFTRIFIYLTLAIGIVFIAVVAIVLVAVGQEKGNHYMVYSGYVAFGVTLIMVIAVFFLRHRIDLTAVMMAECCRGLQHNTPGVFIVSFGIVVVYALFVCTWSASFVYLYSIPGANATNTRMMEVPTADGLSTELKLTHVPSYNPEDFDQNIRNVMLFQVFGFFWTTALLAAISEMVVSGAVASWYFSRTTGNVQSFSPTFASLSMALTKSLGSLAFGALILAVVRFINYLLDRVRRANEKSGGNRLVGFLVACVQCCLGCVERLIQYVNKYAYIYIAMYGDNFCSSANSVYNLMSRNAFTLVIADMITGWVLLVGKLFGCAVCVLLVAAATDNNTSPLSLTIVAVGSLTVFHLYSLVIHMGLDTVFVCYLEDLERNRESKNYYMTPSTHDTLQSAARSKGIN